MVVPFFVGPGFGDVRFGEVRFGDMSVAARGFAGLGGAVDLGPLNAEALRGARKGLAAGPVRITRGRHVRIGSEAALRAPRPPSTGSRRDG